MTLLGRFIHGALLLGLLAATPTLYAQDEMDEGGPQGELALEELRAFADVFTQIRHAYVEEVDDKTLLEYAIRGMLQNLDPHSAYLDQKSYDDLQVNTTGEFGGLGLEVGMENGFVKVITPIDGTPAEQAGIEAGDLIIRLDSRPVKGMSLEDAVTLMRGPKGSAIDLTVIRESVQQPLEFSITRDVIKVRSVRNRTLEPGYGYVRVAQFQNNTGEDFRRAVQALQAENKPLKGLVLDLRNNPGGILQSSVAVADALLTEGLIVYTQGRLPNADTEFSASGDDIIDGIPLVVLINGGSASASEIVAGALQDHRRAVVMGTDSFGKGSVQTVVPLSETRAIKLTTARYYTPGGRSIQAQGIEPDIVVERARVETLASTGRFTEADLQGHLSNGNGETESTTRDRQQRTKDALISEDNQLYEALNLLKGLNILQRRTAETGGAARAGS